MSKPYKICQNCGSHLDPGEVCFCKGIELPKAAPEEVPRVPLKLKPPHAKKRNEKPRYELCRKCGFMWNVSKETLIPRGGYICPRCKNT